jgi:predicted DCC family thiol-disulfide oxidoreductase YuxK
MDDSYVIIFDDHCLLCSRIVQFIIKYDRKALFVFTALDTPFSQRVQENCHCNRPKSDTIVVVKGLHCFYKSDAVLEIIKELDSYWSWLRFTRFIPKGIRDFIYDIVARYRYRFFGVTTHCIKPPDAFKDRFKV